MPDLEPVRQAADGFKQGRACLMWQTTTDPEEGETLIKFAVARVEVRITRPEVPAPLHTLLKLDRSPEDSTDAETPRPPQNFKTSEGHRKPSAATKTRRSV